MFSATHLRDEPDGGRRRPVEPRRSLYEELVPPFSAAEAGPKTITAQTRFVMCQEQACKPASETIAFNIEVQPPGSPPTAGSKAKHDGKPAAPGKKAPPKTATP